LQDRSTTSYGGRNRVRPSPWEEPLQEKIKGFSAGADTVGLFFGEDIFVAIGSILLITGFVDATYGLQLEAIDIALWAIPTGICALLIDGTRLLLLDRQLDKLHAAVKADNWPPSACCSTPPASAKRSAASPITSCRRAR